jgi:glycosyltransferase involved in cell wall biosynthesis
VTGSHDLKFDPLDWPSDLEVLPTSYSWETLAKRIADSIRRADPDIVIGCSMVGAPLAMRLLRSSGGHRTRYIDVIHVDTESEYERVVANADVCDGVAGVSATIVEKAERVLNGCCDVSRIFYPVPCPAAPPSKRQHEPLRIGYVGRLAPEKRVIDFVPLLKELASRGTAFEFTFVGDGPERAVLERTVRDAVAGCAPIRFVGWLRSEQVLEEVSRLDVVVMLSETEGQPIALLEAMSMAAVPVVT